MRPDGLVDLAAAQIDSVVLESLPRDLQFDVAVRIVGAVQDFEASHLLQVALSDPQLVEVAMFDVPIEPRAPAATYIEGYEINHHVGLRIDFEADQLGGYDLAFALDGQPEHRHKTTLSVVQKH
jgi:hypothetical protein